MCISAKTSMRNIYLAWRLEQCQLPYASSTSRLGRTRIRWPWFLSAKPNRPSLVDFMAVKKATPVFIQLCRNKWREYFPYAGYDANYLERWANCLYIRVSFSLYFLPIILGGLGALSSLWFKPKNRRIEYPSPCYIVQSYCTMVYICYTILGPGAFSFYLVLKTSMLRKFVFSYNYHCYLVNQST